MKFFRIALLLLCPFTLLAQTSMQEMEKEWRETTNNERKFELAYQLAEGYLSRGDEEKAEEFADQAVRAGNAMGDRGRVARAYYIYGQAHLQDRDERAAMGKFTNSIDNAKAARDLALTMEVYNELIELTRKERGYNAAYRRAQEAIDFLLSNTNYQDLRNLRTSMENQRIEIRQQNAQLEAEKQQLVQELRRLEQDKSRLSQSNTQLERSNDQLAQQRRQLAQEKAQVEQQVSEKEEAIASMSIEAAKARLVALERKQLIDSLEFEKEMQEATLTAQQAQLQQRELEIQRNNYLILGAISFSLLLMVLAGSLYLRYRTKKKSNDELAQKNEVIAEEQKRSDKLLLNILPAPIAKELKETGSAKARKYDEVTVLFSDFKNFTGMSERLSPEKLVEELDACFKKFDEIISEYPDIEKIKTIGDAYMCASGLVGRKTIPTNIIKAALEMQEYLEDKMHEKILRNEPYFEARIGIHTGPVVAGVVGNKKFAYDIWGDTVNIAARMEAKCEVGRVNVSDVTHGLVKYNFDFDHRGKVEAKNKGMIDMYYVRQLVKA